MEKNKIPKPYRQLLPIILLQAINLVIYLYVISVNGTSLNLINPGQKDITFLIVVGSYISTTIATLLTLTSYFSVKAFVKRYNIEPTAPMKPIITQKEEKLPRKETKQGLLAGFLKREKKNPQVIQNISTPDNKQIEIKPTEVKEPTPPKKEEAATIKNKSNWKTIGVKATDEDTIKDSSENITNAGKQEIPKELGKGIERKSETEKISDAIIEKKSQDPENKEKISEIKNDPTPYPPLQPIVVETKNLLPDNQLEEKIQDVYNKENIELDSEVIQTLDELKQMVEEMKISKKVGIVK